MKPTHNAISAEGVKLVSFNIDNIDTCGFFARSIEDPQLVANVFALGKDEPLKTVPLKETRIAFIKPSFWPSAGSGTVTVMEKAAKILKKHCVLVEEIDLLSEFSNEQTLWRTHRMILDVEAQAAFLMEYRMDKTKLSPKIRSIVENASNFTLKETVEAVDRYARMRSTFDKFAANFSAIITPYRYGYSGPRTRRYGHSRFTFPQTVSLIFVYWSSNHF